MNWIEELPEKCPPEDAFEPNGMQVYRLATSENTEEIDFQSQRALNPNKTFIGIDECIARSLSVYNEIGKCWNMIKLPFYKNRWKAVLGIELNNSDGLVKKTFKDPNHYSWWRTTNFELTKVVLITNEYTA